ncbi:GntR family transcriptional regulator/MocR family aminotransferase [Natronocella acetinitrilica]|uniref:GntR family transcriptional regulator/MocR family aminotransferase n=1 Tax=Natronocella acetinitrilica TaxID=414046 RepID=A0AAE3KEA0_9GAMM|nr:PLP-dependent aminotransferase family protein [Natronocella acetinitrilica]MCP1677253.1 GntR family transcriptional regulator/MocR family aminotransferase [Natronocella acetinitrilica]
MPSKNDDTMWPRLFQLDSDSSISLQQQIREALVSAILSGQICADSPLPSSRRLATQLGVARNTVVLAYQHMADSGYLLPRERSGYFVNREILCNRVETTASGSNEVDRIQAGVTWNSKLRIRPSTQRNIIKPPDWSRYEYPFIYGQMDPAHFPVQDWRECYRHALTVQGLTSTVRDQLDADHDLLVEQIRSRVLPRRGIWADGDEILVTMGSQNALYLLATLLVGPSNTVGIEDPGYPDARNLLCLNTANIKALPVDHGGLIVDDRLNDCDYLFVTPSHHSPTTVTMPLDRRNALLERAEKHDLLIIEDDYESEINFLGSPTASLKSLDRNDRVLYMGSLSKTLDPGLRIGYLVGAAPLIREARALRRLMLRHPPTNNQHAAALFLALGHHDALIQRLSHIYRERWLAMNEALANYIPDSTHTHSFGGTSFWVRGPENLDARSLSEAAMAQGIVFEPGDINFFHSPPSNYFRLGFSSIAVDKIEPGIRRLATMMEKHSR